MADIDYTGAQTLAELGRELRGTGAELVLTEVSDAILHRVATTGIDADLTVVATPGGRSPRPTNPARPHHKVPRGLIQGVVFRVALPFRADPLRRTSSQWGDAPPRASRR